MPAAIGMLQTVICKPQGTKLLCSRVRGNDLSEFAEWMGGKSQHEMWGLLVVRTRGAGPLSLSYYPW